MIILLTLMAFLVPVFVAMILAVIFGALMIFGRWCYGWKGELLAVAILLAGSFVAISRIEAWFDSMWEGVDGPAGLGVLILQLMCWGTLALTAIFVIGGRVSGFK